LFTDIRSVFPQKNVVVAVLVVVVSNDDDFGCDGVVVVVAR